PLVDRTGFGFGLIAGGPRDENWNADVAEEAARLMEEAAATLPTSIPASRQPRRGPYHSKTVGISMGGGQEEPMPFFHSALNTLVLAQLLATKPFQRIAGFVNGMFKSYAPVLHEHYRSTLAAIHTHLPGLPRNYDEFVSVFAAATFNFGPRTVTLPHLDFANLAWGWCAITALGHFDPDKGGHLILWDLRIVIRFPPGSTIFIPSAILRHSNVSIQQDETRYSFTQFSAAGLFRYVYNGFRTEKEVVSGMSKAEKVQRAEDCKTRWFDGLKMFKQWNVESKSP
ncbi:hypothetical protein DFH06DRAFT_980706, partial [Mycena polygramma]